MTKDKITKQDLWTEIKLLNAKLDKVLDLLQSKSVVNNVTVSIEDEAELEDFFKKIKTKPFIPSGDLQIE